MAKQKYWDGTKWVQIAPSMKEFDEHKADYANPHNVTAGQVGAVAMPQEAGKKGQLLTLNEELEPIWAYGGQIETAIPIYKEGVQYKTLTTNPTTRYVTFNTDHIYLNPDSTKVDAGRQYPFVSTAESFNFLNLKQIAVSGDFFYAINETFGTPNDGNMNGELFDRVYIEIYDAPNRQGNKLFNTFVTRKSGNNLPFTADVSTFNGIGYVVVSTLGWYWTNYGYAYTTLKLRELNLFG